MSLYALKLPWMDFILPDLLDITEGDTAIGQTTGYNKDGTVSVDYFRVTYDLPNHNNFAATILQKIANQAKYAVHINAVNSTYVVPSGTPISTRAGVTFAPWQVPDPDQDQIHIYYDVYDCSGSNYWVLGMGGQHVWFPSYICLFHELSHVLRIVEGKYKQGDNVPAEETLAIKDENILRAQHINLVTSQAQPLPQRDLVYGPGAGGCGFQIPPDEMKNPTKPVKNSYCFIATAAYADRDIARVRTIQELREIHLCRSAVVGDLLSELVDQYYRFSPSVAIAMHNNPELRRAITQLIVDPLLAFYIELERYFAEYGQAASGSQLLSLFSCQPAALRAASCLPTEVLEELRHQKAHLAARLGKPQAPPPPPTELITGNVFSFVVNSIIASAPPNHMLEWALIDPLIIYWSAADNLEHDCSGPMTPVSKWTDAIEEWLGQAPLPQILAQLDEDLLGGELERLKNTVFLAPSVREAVAHHLMEVPWSHGIQKLTTILRRTKFSLGSP